MAHNSLASDDTRTGNHAELPHTFTRAQQRYILDSCWPTAPSSTSAPEHLEQYKSYFKQYYAIYCFETQRLPQLTHESLCGIVKHLPHGTRHSCRTIIKALVFSDGDDNTINRVINIAAKALLMLDVVAWQDTETLREYLARSFAPQRQLIDDFRMSQNFNASVFQNVAGINVQWTQTLNHHLQVSTTDSDISLFLNPSTLR